MIALYILFLFRYILNYSNNCYKTCLKCTELGDENDHKCVECLYDYFFFENTDNCYSYFEIPENYFLYFLDNRLYQCDKRCKSCYSFSENYTDNCFECTEDYKRINRFFCVKHLNKYTVKYLDKSLINIYNETSPLEHTKYYSVVFYNYLETEEVNKYYNIGNISRIYIDNCIKKIKLNFNLTDEELFIAKYDIINENFHLNKLIFYIFYVLDNEFYDFDLDICINETILVERPITNFTSINYTFAKNISEYSVNIYNESDEFFNDICFPFNYQKKSDVLLKDRRSQFYLNITLCENGCELKKNIFNKDRIICECNVTIFKNPKSFFLGSIKEDFDIIIKQFKIELYNSNFFIVKCYKLVFNLKYLKDNYGFFFQITLFVLNFILFLIYSQKFKISKLINYLINLYKRKTSFYFPNETENNFNSFFVSDVSKFKFLNDNSKNMISYSNNKDNYDFENKYYLKLRRNKTKNNSIHVNKIFSTNINVKKNNVKNNMYKSDIANFQKKNLYNKIKKTKSNKKKEKANFIFLFKKYIKEIHMVIKLFYINKLEISIIHIMNLIFVISLQNTITALFYDDKNIRNVFYNDGNFSFVKNFPRIIYSYLLMIFINFFLIKLITTKNVLEKLLKHKYKYNIFVIKMKKRIRIINIKINIYFVINFIFSLFFIYYCTAFCSVYRYNQKFWLLNVFLTIILNLVYPFLICFVFVLLKMIALKMKVQWINNLVEFMVSFF